MTTEIRQEVHEHWNYCSDFLKKALLNRYHAIQAISEESNWLEFLADEFGLIEATPKTG
jgi:hypothetical protein